MESLCILTNTYTTDATAEQFARKVLFPSCLVEHIPVSPIKDDLNKENARIKQVLMENGYQESIMSKIFKKITYNDSLSQSQQCEDVVA